jgi:3D (Asp-Asp-Asp) domain-containing protein
MKKYNTAIHISFWMLVFLLISIVTFSIFSDNYKIGSFLPFLKSAGFSEKVVVTKIKEVEKKVDWYYFVASGYSADDPVQGTDNLTATGKEVGAGIIAVDPDVIPLGTKIEIKNMGFFTAEDTGGKIKGNRIDIYFDSKKEAQEFGKKGVWVKIIDSSYKLDLADL